MRTLLMILASLGSAALLGLGAAGAQDATQPPPPPLTTPEQNKQSTAGQAAAGPMYDMNIFRQKIPPVLLTALADPYQRPPRSCAALYARVAELNDALGPDFDLPESRATQGDLKLSLLHAGSEMLLPFSGAVRAISGAQKHDQQVLSAIIAGSVRRAYLKGLGEAHGCAPPATPRHFVVAPAPPPEEGHMKPLYPVQ